jgi:streptomycin 6-kinase
VSSTPPSSPLASYLARWALEADGEIISTPSSLLLPVKRDGVPLMLKLARDAEEKRGAHVLRWWNGDHAARVIAWDGEAMLMERAAGTVSLADMARGGEDDAASRIMCEVAARLHAPRSEPLPRLVPLVEWFRALPRAAASYGGIFAQASAVAGELLQTQSDVAVLHGDIHHGNVLDFGPRGFLAIDPKGLVGDRSFDYANIFCNPDHATCTAPGRLARQAFVVAEAAKLDRERLLKWILAYAGLSAAWSFEDGHDASTALAVAAIAATTSGQS